MAKGLKARLKAALQLCLANLRGRVGPLLNPTGDIYVWVGRDGDVDEFKKRLKHFVPRIEGRYKLLERYSLRALLSHAPVVVLDGSWGDRAHSVLGLYNLDYRKCADDAWNWFRLASFLDREKIDLRIKEAEAEFREVSTRLKKDKSRAYIFGTGSSLERAGEMDWSNGIRIVSNTIVKDEALWRHIDPHFIVAGDALYHFGHTPFAVAFRSDLRLRLAESSAYFVYPSIFDPVVRRELSDLQSRLIPIPYGSSRVPICDLMQGFELPLTGNVLNLLLLPIASTLAKDIFLWGFDGKAPGDKMFWKNSERHFYQEFVPQLEAAHPAFFAFQLPKDKPDSYVNSVHGDILDAHLSRAEEKGYRFILLHKSWTKTLQKRYSDPALCSVGGANARD